jgi:hypothetical protein
MRLSCRMLPVAAFVAFSLASSPARAATGAAGHWEGKIRIPDHELSFTVDLSPGTTGGWIGSLTIAGSASVDVPLLKITVNGAGVQFSAALPGDTFFEGTLSTDARSLTGQASTLEGSAPFELARNGEAKVKAPPPSSPLSTGFGGTWLGTLEADGKARRIQLTMTSAADGTAQAALVSLDKGNLTVPVTTVTLQGERIELEARSISGRYRGTLSPSGEITGEWTEPSLHLPLTFRHVSDVK